MRMRARAARLIVQSDRVVLWGIGLASLARLAYILYLGDDLGGPDSDTYDAAGSDLARRGFLSEEVTGLPYFPPGYPLLVGLHYELFGDHPIALKLSQIVVIGLLTWLTYRIALRTSERAIALLAGLGMSMSLAWIALAHPLMYEPWAALALMAAVLLLLRWHDTPNVWMALAAGIALGAGAALQDKFLTFVPVAACWIALARSRPTRLRAIAAIALLAGVASIVVPLVARNQIVYGEPLVLAHNHGVNLFIGNSSHADGGFVGIDPTPPECPGVSVFAERDRAANDRALIGCAIGEALDDPLHLVQILPRKVALLWAPFVGPFTERTTWRHFFDVRAAFPDALTTSSWFRRIDVGASLAWILGSLVLTAVGAVQVTRAKRDHAAWMLVLPVLWLTAVHIVTFGDSRFRIPVMPLALILQCFALTTLGGRVARLGTGSPADHGRQLGYLS